MTQAVAAPRVAQAPAAPGTSPQLVYRGLRDQREVLGNQLENAQRMRENLVSELQRDGQNAATKVGLEKRIANVDARITDLDQQIAKSDQAVAEAAAVPGATYRPPDPPRRGPPEEAYALSALFLVVAILPMSIAFARRIWRRSAKATVVLPPEMSERMESLERGMDAIALEVERIGEGQRFMTQALAERVEGRALGAGAAQPIPARQAERVEERR